MIWTDAQRYGWTCVAALAASSSAPRPRMFISRLDVLSYIRINNHACLRFVLFCHHESRGGFYDDPTKVCACAATYINYFHSEVDVSLNEASTGDRTRCSWRIIAYVRTRHPAYAVPARELFSLVAAKVVYGSLIVAFRFLAHLFIAQSNFLEIQINQLHRLRSHAIRSEGESCCHNRFRISPLANNRASYLSRVSTATATAKPSVIFGVEEARYLDE